MHLLIFVLMVIAQSTFQEPSFNYIKEYGVPGLLILLMLGMFKYFMHDSDRKNEMREKKIMDYNELREKALLQQGDELRRLVDRIGQDWRDTNNKLDRNYQEAISKFISVINTQFEQNNYTTQVLTELRDKVEEVFKKGQLGKTEFAEFKTDLLGILNRIALEYNLTAKVKV